ncbi:MAG TPA: mannosyltransferase family protein [Chthoniobacterales bacterium]|nr:mannosyltransferase family protein [Chthoniobacterales bacterium]
MQVATGALATFVRSWVFRDVVIPFLATRVMLVVVAWLAFQSFQDLPAKPNTWEIRANGKIGKVVGKISPDVYPLINMWSRWDAGWYQSIAEKGYDFVPNRRSSTAFFPVYPMLMRAVHRFSPSGSDGSWLVCGIIVSNAALLVALIYLVRLVRIDFDHAAAARSALYLLVFPTSLFFSAVYSESLFLAFTLACFYHARKEQWWLAGIIGAAAALTRSLGILLVAPLAVEYLMQRRFNLRAIRPNVAAIALIPAALAALMWYWSWRFGNMMATQDAQAAWGGGWGAFTLPWKPFVRFIQQPFILNDVINFSFAGVLLALIVFVAVKLRPSYGVYAASCYLFVTSWGTFESVPRYVLVIFPAFIALAQLGRKPAFDRAYLAIATGLAAFFMIRFSLWRWVA